jgi:alkylhydroperoxidase family enzyme
MTKYPVHTLESAPETSKSALAGLQKALGMVPNLAATMASSPTLVNGFVGAFANFHGGTFSGAEKQALLLTNAVANRAEWAVAFHSTLALKEGIAPEDVEAIRDQRLPTDPRLRALVQLDRALIEARGAVTAAQLDAFSAAGFTADQVLEMIAGVAVSVMANYASNITCPPLEEPFRAQAWRR